MMLDHSGAVERAVILDIITASQMYAHTNQEIATKYFWWFFLIQSAPLPEYMIAATPELYLRSNLSDMISTPGAITPDAYAEYFRCLKNPATIHAICEDYRASATIDLSIEGQLKGFKIQQPLQVLWGGKGAAGQLFDILGLWKEWADHVSGYPLPCGHLIPEEDPQGLLNALGRFLVI